HLCLFLTFYISYPPLPRPPQKYPTHHPLSTTTSTTTTSSTTSTISQRDLKCSLQVYRSYAGAQECLQLARPTLEIVNQEKGRGKERKGEEERGEERREEGFLMPGRQ